MDYKERKRKATETLAEINPFKPFNTELFNKLARVTISVAIETVALRLGKGIDGLEVLMTQRPKNDPYWPGQWHSPGSILRPGEKISDVFERLIKKEFLHPFKEEPKFKGFLNHSNLPRGHELALIYEVELAGTPREGKWFPTDQLPESTIEHHKKVIPFAVSRYGMIQFWTRTGE